MLYGCVGGKAMGRLNVLSYSAKQTYWIEGRIFMSNESKPGCVSALVNWRARSARKLKKMTESPSPTVATGSPSSRVTTIGSMNSSETLRSYDSLMLTTG